MGAWDQVKGKIQTGFVGTYEVQLESVSNPYR